MYKADGKNLDTMTPAELAALPNFFDDQKPAKYKEAMKDQKYYEEQVNGKNITLDQFMHEICPMGFFWVMVDGMVLQLSMSWEPGYVGFTPYCYKLYGGFLRSIVSIHPQGLLTVDYDNPKKAEQFNNLLSGYGAKASTLYNLFGGGN